ncbi:MAG TPA: hypothetical protein VLA44_02970 [Clostridia bacterium]|nr:hypothetical protein [Clostridia bacterium]
MTPATSRLRILVWATAFLVVGCDGGSGRTGTGDSIPPALEATNEPSNGVERSPRDRMSPALRPETDRPTATDPGTTTQTDTDWGRIWDDVPAAFPVYPTAVRSEEAGGGEPVSATYTIPGAEAVADVVGWMQSELELATYSTFALSGPLEDGGYVIDSVGDGDCRIETRIAPAGGVTIVTVRYGADCPFH